MAGSPLKRARQKAARLAAGLPAKPIPQRGNRYTQEFKDKVIADTLVRLENGETTDAIAKDHGCAGSSIRHWLLADPEAERARASYLIGEVLAAHELIKEAPDQLALARAREMFRSASWLAERRLPRMFGANSAITIQNGGADFAEMLRRAQERVIPHE